MRGTKASFYGKNAGLFIAYLASLDLADSTSVAIRDWWKQETAKGLTEVQSVTVVLFREKSTSS